MIALQLIVIVLFLFTATATTEIYTLSLHDALPIFWSWPFAIAQSRTSWLILKSGGSTVLLLLSFCSLLFSSGASGSLSDCRSEEHTSELQSQFHLVCRLLLEKKKTQRYVYSATCFF